MKSASLGHLQEARYNPWNLLELFSTGFQFPADPRNGLQETLGIGMKGFLKEVFHWSFLHHFAHIHD
jgi:hypothetical protein